MINSGQSGHHRAARGPVFLARDGPSWVSFGDGRVVGEFWVRPTRFLLREFVKLARVGLVAPLEWLDLCY
jgi:hypothetical protein